MKETIDALKATDIISTDNISQIKKYIMKKYPGYNYEKQTRVFADSVHKILNKNLKPFKKIERDNIKNKVLTNAVNKKEFSVSAYEIFRECIIQNNGEKGYCSNIEEWLNNQKNIIIDSAEFKDFLITLWKEPGGSIDEAIYNAAQKNNKRITVDTFDKNNVVKAESKDTREGLGQRESADMGNSGNNKSIVQVKIKDNISIEEVTFLGILGAGCRLLLLKIKGIIRSILKLILFDKKYRRTFAILSCTAIIIIFCGIFGIRFVLDNKQTPAFSEYEAIPNGDMGIIDGLSDEFKYFQIDKALLKQWLNDKNSILSDDKYLIPIIDASKEFNVNPLLLIAITGQEQSFVPRNVKGAQKIANNPFNVFGSWQDYNTNIRDSARLAAMTIVDSSKGRPVNADELEWINKRYAQDSDWWIGVKKIFYQIKNDIVDN